MKYLLSKGLIYHISKDNLLTILHNGKLIELNKAESLIWNECSWNPQNYETICKKHMNSFDFSLEMLKQKGLICVCENNSKEDCIFEIIANNKIKLLNISTKEKLKSGNYKHIIKDIKSYNNLTSFDKMIYAYLKDYNGEISISDIVLILDDNLFNMNFFTNGYTKEYIKVAKKSKSSNAVMQSVLKLLNAKLIYMS